MDSIPTDPAKRSFDQRVDELIAKAEVSLAEEAIAVAATEAQNTFALALQAVLGWPRGNLFYSPFGIHTALAVAYAGARGRTAEEMRAALQGELSDENPREDLPAAIGRLKGSTDAGCELLIATSLWTQAGMPLLPSFAQLISQRYGATLSAVDFRSDSSGARKTINDWVSACTNHRIGEVLNPPLPTPETRLILANAVYFKGAWQDPFERERTREMPFYLEDGATVPAALMHATRAVGYRRGPGYQAVTLPYRGTTLAMMVLLPERKDGLRDLETALTVSMLRELARLPNTKVELFLPRFAIHWDAGLVETLRELGVQRAFTPEADFSGIDGRKPPDKEALYLSEAIHRAFCEVNEEGTEAAAVTAFAMAAIGLPGRPQPPPVFRADHPFFFAIVDRTSGAILFIGRLVDPGRAA